MSKVSPKTVAVTSLLLLFATLAPNLQAAPVSGTVSGYQSISQVRCRNTTSRQRVITAVNADGSWNCEQAGLVVKTGDNIAVDFQLAAQGLLPDRPQALSTLGATNFVQLQWSPVATATHYSVYRDTQPAVVPSAVTKLIDVVEPRYNDNSVTPDVMYFYVVTATNGTGEGLPSAVALGTTNAAGLDHRTLPTTCSQGGCHDGMNATGKPANHLPTTSECSNCHQTTAWLPAVVNHTGIVNNCAVCHNGTFASGKLPTHLPTTGDCSTCHTTVAWRPALFDHTGIVSSCATCHNGATASGKPANHLPTTGDCSTCHTTTAWLPAHFIHTGIVNNCAACHNGVNATGKPVTHLATTQDCSVCHQTSLWLPATYTHRTANYPGDHNPRVTCVSCHVNNSEAIIYNTPSLAPSCAACHAARYMPSVGAHGGQPVLVNNNCGQSGCHRVGDAIW